MSTKRNKIRVGIIGASGYTGGELLRLLIHHPNVDIVFAKSNTHKGKLISNLFNDLEGEIDMKFSSTINQDIDVLFLCTGHSKTVNFLNENKLKKEIKIIDLSQDFRLENSYDTLNHKRQFIYGLPELKKEEIKNANNIANPGCFATVIQLGLLPIISKNLVFSDIHVNAVTGSTGAGIKPKATSHFSWRNNNISWYKPFEHQHLNEIYHNFKKLSKKKHKINFLPMRGNFTRGIFCTSYFKSEIELDSIYKVYSKFYKNHPFTNISKNEIDLKQVINTNKCLIHLCKKDDIILITSVIDNLIKGASGQAIQNMNLMFDLNENQGLKLKSSIY